MLIDSGVDPRTAKSEREAGSAVIDPVWRLLEKAYALFGVVPTLLERDFNIPALSELLEEVEVINHLQTKWINRACEHIQHT